jgi:hypothetical protein
VLDFLGQQGVSQSSIEELRKGMAHNLVEDSEEDRETDNLVKVLERAQKYASRITPSTTRGKQQLQLQQQQKRHPAAATVVCLINVAWEALCRYRLIQYKSAYRSFHSLRRQRSLMKKGSRNTSGTGDIIQQSRRLQSARAEQLCNCQRGLIMAKAWEERQLL